MSAGTEHDAASKPRDFGMLDRKRLRRSALVNSFSTMAQVRNETPSGYPAWTCGDFHDRPFFA